ncbi:MAG: hypothetical protein ACRYGP_07220 [Janthinobacterium lividum]
MRSVAAATVLLGLPLFYLSLLGALDATSSGWPGFMMSGDVQKFYMPSYVEGYRRFWHGGMAGIDFLTDDGASVFAFRANLSPYYPPYLLSYLILDVSNITKAVIAYSLIHVAHTAAALYCCVMLGRRFLRLSTAASVLFALLFCLSYQAAAYTAFATFFFQIMLVPIVAYTLCCLMLSRSRLAPVLASPVPVTLFLSSYGPMMLGALASALIVVAFVFFTRVQSRFRRPGLRLVPPGAAMVIAVAAVAPYYIGQSLYAGQVAPAYRSVQAIAQELAFSGRDLLNALSESLHWGATVSEGHLIWGLIPAILVLVGLLSLASLRPTLRPTTARTFCFALVAYVAFLSIVLGRSLSTADMFYYAVPILGKMHAFQRYLLFGQVFLALAAAAGAQIFAERASPAWRTVAVAVAAVLALAVTVEVNADAALASVVDVGPFLTEVFLGFAAVAALAVGRSSRALVTVGVMSSLVSVQTMYSMQANLGRPDIWKSELNPEGQDASDFKAFLKANSTKALSKMLYLTSGPGSFLYRNYPWLVGSDVKVMSYQGYEPHLAMMRDYWAFMGGYYGEFNRDWIRRTGLDYLVWDSASAPRTTDLGHLLGEGVHLGPVLNQSGSLSVAKVVYDAPPSLGDTQPTLDLAEDDPVAWSSIVNANGWKVVGGRIAKIPGTTSSFQIPVSTKAGVAYDISFRAVGAKGTVFPVIGGAAGVVIRVTADGVYSARMTPVARGDLVLIATSDFDGALTDIQMTEVTAHALEPLPVAFDDGILRLEADPAGTEIHRTKTNFATRVEADVTVGSASRLVYLLWPMPYMVPYLDGERVVWTQDANEPAYIDLPPGHHRFELKFTSFWNQAFTVTTLLYLAVLIAALAMTAWARRRPSRRKPEPA